MSTLVQKIADFDYISKFLKSLHLKAISKASFLSQLLSNQHQCSASVLT